MIETIIRLPRLFFDDHEARDLPTPERVSQNSQSVWIRPGDPNLPELISDADHYASEGRAGGFDPDIRRTICRGAERLLAAIERAGIRWRKQDPPRYGIEIIATGEGA